VANAAGILLEAYGLMRKLALPRDVRQGKFEALRNGLGKKRLIVFQDVSEWPPKLEEKLRFIFDSKHRSNQASIIAVRRHRAYVGIVSGYAA
jgi:hypothetical protein